MIMSKLKIASNPPTLPPPSGRFSQIVNVRANTLLFIAGQTASDKNGNIVGIGDLKAQAEQAFLNLKAALDAGGATFDDLVKMNTYVTDIKQYRSVVRSVRDKYITKDPPVGTLVEVSSLARPDLLIEIEGVAVLD